MGPTAGTPPRLNVCVDPSICETVLPEAAERQSFQSLAVSGQSTGTANGCGDVADRNNNPTNQNNNIGFHLAYVPEPTSIVLFAFGGLAVLKRKRKPA